MDALLLEKIGRSYEEDPLTGCWNWKRGKFQHGYGAVRVGAKTMKAHRVSYELFVGPIPPGLTIDHLCRNTSCINPAHLEPVTIRENILRGNGPAAINRRKTHCIRGHEFTLENVKPQPNGKLCRTCWGDYMRRYELKRRGMIRVRNKPLATP